MAAEPVSLPVSVRQAGPVQTFLPYSDFSDALAVLDSPRLGKQRVETLQILRALVLPEYGWRNHPAVRMWRGRLPALVLYGLISVEQWKRRGFGDTTAGNIAEFAPEVVGATQADLAVAGWLPGWLGDERLHRSHRSKLLAKDPAHYRKYFHDVPSDLDYFWPEPDEPLGEEQTSADHKSLWVIRPESPHTLGQFLHEGIISTGEGSGIDVDAAGQDLSGLRALLGPTVRRNSRQLSALARFLTEIDVGDHTAVQIHGGSSLVVGEVTGEYEFVPRAHATEHRRRVRWDHIIPRSAVQPTSALQDVRPLFRVSVGAGHALSATRQSSP
jgi:hypothetical protein